MQKLPKTKIVATIGPASWSTEVLREMINSGLQVARVNASFADFAELERVALQIREISPKVTLMLDTKGHKIRVTGFEEDRTLITGEAIVLASDTSTVNRPEVIKITYPTLHNDVTRGVKILFDDGNITVQVEDIQGQELHCRVVAGGILKKRKTVNIPGVHLNFPGLSEKDEGDIKYAVANGYDLISASFIRNAQDIALIRTAMGDTDTKLIAKIEDAEGVNNFDEILSLVDGIMVARGDMGVEIPLERVPILQKEFIYKCRAVGKPVIVATQMLESMRENNRPTRAEVSDVANAVMDGADAVMLSAETSTGKYPVEAIKTMAKIALEAESVLKPQQVIGNTSASIETDAICRHIFSIAEEIGLKGVIVFSQTGKSVASLSRHRLNIPIWSVSRNPKLIRQESLLRGVTPYYIREFSANRDELIKSGLELVYSHGSLAMDDKVAVLSGSSVANKGTNSILEIITVKDALL